MQQFGFDSEDAEDEGEDGAAEIEQYLAGVDDSAGEVFVVGENLGVIDGGVDRGENIAVEPRGISEKTDPDDQTGEHCEAEDAGDGLVAGEGAREDADGNEEQAGYGDEEVAADQGARVEEAGVAGEFFQDVEKSAG